MGSMLGCRFSGRSVGGAKPIGAGEQYPCNGEGYFAPGRNRIQCRDKENLEVPSLLSMIRPGWEGVLSTGLEAPGVGREKEPFQVVVGDNPEEVVGYQ